MWERIDKGIRKARYRQHYDRRRLAVIGHDTSYREKLIRCLVKSATDARKIGLRDHISPEKIIRIGHFITCLRRDLDYYKVKDDYSFLTNPSTWSEILVLAGDWQSRGGTEIREAVRAAQIRMEEDTEGSIVQGFEETNELLKHADRIIDEAKEIDKNSEEIIEGINSVAQSIHDTYN